MDRARIPQWETDKRPRHGPILILSTSPLPGTILLLPTSFVLSNSAIHLPSVSVPHSSAFP